VRYGPGSRSLHTVSMRKTVVANFMIIHHGHEYMYSDLYMFLVTSTVEV